MQLDLAGLEDTNKVMLCQTRSNDWMTFVENISSCSTGLKYFPSQRSVSWYVLGASTVFSVFLFYFFWTELQDELRVQFEVIRGVGVLLSYISASGDERHVLKCVINTIESRNFSLR